MMDTLLIEGDDDLAGLMKAMSVGILIAGKPVEYIPLRQPLKITSFEPILHIVRLTKSQARKDYYNYWLEQPTPEWKQAENMVKRLRYGVHRRNTLNS